MKFWFRTLRIKYVGTIDLDMDDQGDWVAKWDDGDGKRRQPMSHVHWVWERMGKIYEICICGAVRVGDREWHVCARCDNGRRENGKEEN